MKNSSYTQSNNDYTEKISYLEGTDIHFLEKVYSTYAPHKKKKKHHEYISKHRMNVLIGLHDWSTSKGYHVSECT